MIKILSILIGIFNVFGIGRSWIAGIIFLFGLLGEVIPENIATILGVILIVVTMLFFIIQSFRLILYFESSRKIQILICVIDILLKIIFTGLIVTSNLIPIPKSISPPVIIIGLIVVLCIDSIVIFFLQKKNVKEAFNIAEENREQKFRMKLMKNN